MRALDTRIELSEPIRVELASLSCQVSQEALVVKACAKDWKSLESIAAVPHVPACGGRVL